MIYSIYPDFYAKKVMNEMKPYIVNLYRKYILDADVEYYEENAFSFDEWLDLLQCHMPPEVPTEGLTIHQLLYLYIVKSEKADGYDSVEQMPYSILGIFAGDWCAMPLHFSKSTEEEAQNWFAELEDSYHMWADKISKTFTDTYSDGDGVPTFAELEGQLR